MAGWALRFDGHPVADSLGAGGHQANRPPLSSSLDCLEITIIKNPGKGEYP